MSKFVAVYILTARITFSSISNNPYYSLLYSKYIVTEMR